MLFNFIACLPDDILHIIWSFVHKRNKIFLNKENYIKYNYLIDNLIQRGRYESYIRDVIRTDSIFLFKYILERNFKAFLDLENFKYDNIIYANYLLFILNFCDKNNSQKCGNLINLQLSLSGFKKKWCKKNRIKYNKWNS